MAFQLSDLSNLYNQVSGYMTASQNAGNVNGIAAQQQGALNGQYSALQNQLAQATQQYATDRGNLDQTNQGLNQQMSAIQQQIAGLSDPNSAYMQQARQGIERKDAAAGRNSQWGDREVQLQALLAENASKYAPGLQQQYTGMANSISDNEAKLNRQYQDALNGFNTQYLGLIGAGNNAANTAAGNQNTANQREKNALGNALKSAMGPLNMMFGGKSGGNGGITDYFAGLASQANGITGYGDGLGNLYGGSGNLSGAGIGTYGSNIGFLGAPSAFGGGFGSGAYGTSGLNNSFDTGSSWSGGGILGGMASSGGYNAGGLGSWASAWD